MPKKRPLEIRMAEARERLDRMELESKIIELRAKMAGRRRRRRATRRN
jgi:hypothetical protein